MKSNQKLSVIFLLIKRLLKKHWNDPVWSKVISAIILAILSGIGTFFIWALKQI